MFTQILYLNWKSSRFGLLLFSLAAFSLPILAVQGLVGDPTLPESGTVRASQILFTLQFWTPLFPALAFAVGTVLALLVWNWDHKGEHIYALSLPLPRWKYVALKMGAGAVLLLLPVFLLWVGALLGTSTIEIPEGLRAYPTAIGFRFFLASLVAYATFSAMAAGTMRTVVIFLSTLVVLLVLGSVVPPYLGRLLDFPPLESFRLLDWFVQSVSAWPGPFEVYAGNWMLIDV